MEKKEPEKKINEEDFVFRTSEGLFEELKYQIKRKYKNQLTVSKKLGVSRKVLNRMLNHNKDLDTIIEICKLLGIEKIVIKP